MTVTWHRMPIDRPNHFDPPEVYGELRENDPVARVKFPAGMEGWLVTRFEDVTGVFRNPSVAAARPRYESPDADPTGKTPTPFSGTLVHLDGEPHNRYRRLLASRFTVAGIKRDLQPYLDRVTTDHLDKIAAGPETFDLVAELTATIPVLVICEMLGVDYADRNAFGQASLNMMDFSRSQVDRDGDRRWILDYIAGLIEQRRRSKDYSGLLGDLIAQVDSGTSFLTDEDLVKLGGLLLVAGHDTTANQLSLSVLTLLAQPEKKQFLTDNPDKIDPIVEELLRYLSIVHFGLGRTVREDFEVRGTQFKKGELVVVSIPAANRDPRIVDHPDVLDFERGPVRHVAFGFGAHQCLGQNVARAELRTVLPALFKRFPNLKLAAQMDEIPMHDHSTNYGVAKLLVTR